MLLNKVKITPYDSLALVLSSLTSVDVNVSRMLKVALKTGPKNATDITL